MDWIALSQLVKTIIADTAIPDQHEIDDLLAQASSDSLTLSQSNRLLSAALAKSPDGIHQQIMTVSAQARRRVFGDRVVVMAPIEVSNICASDCVFCGWRSSNTQMRRLRQTTDLILPQVDYLLDKGIDYIELVGGDDFRFVRDQVPHIVPLVKERVRRHRNAGVVCVCSMAMTANHYKQWKEWGVDAMFVWQETYDPDVYARHILAGPKAHGITDDYKLGPKGSGYQFRLDAQERAMRAGLDVALGVMLGLSPSPHFEFLMLLQHTRYLLNLECGQGAQIIVGMPTWNKLTTPATDLRPRLEINLKTFSPIYAALLFLCLPKGRPWVFPTCRVSEDPHLTAVEIAGPFTCTEINLGPGGYLPRAIKQQQANGVATDALMEQMQRWMRSESKDLNAYQQEFDAAEQFMHYHHQHDQLAAAMQRRQLRLVSTEELIAASMQAANAVTAPQQRHSDPVIPALDVR